MGLLDRFMVKMLIASASLVCLIEAEGNFVCTTEKHRPKYHFSSKSGWINDPNGMVYYDGIYHLFYQHHPFSLVWGPMHWGHAISRNLATWEELPIALKPNNLGAIFSGSSVVDYKNTTGFMKSPNGKDPIVAIYTSAGESIQAQSIAYSLDGGYNFSDYTENPVLNPTDTPDFRDPKVFYLNDRWIMALAVSNRIEFYSSPDLKKWSKESEFGRNPEMGNHHGVWECPDLMPLNVFIDNTELWVLLVSINPGGPNRGSATQYFIGTFTNSSRTNFEFRSFQWSENQWLDWGPDNYAGVTFSNDPNSKHIYMGWMSNWNYASDTPNLSHRGQMTIPRQLGLRVFNHTTGQYRLTSVPIPELVTLRHPLQTFIQNEAFSVIPQTLIPLTEQATFKTPTMEIEINLEMKNNPKFSICAFNDVNEEVCFGFDSTHWFLDRSKSGDLKLNDEYERTLSARAAREINDESTSIRIFLDVSSIEVFTDGGLTAMTALYFPSKPFDKIYISHWSNAVSLSAVTVKNFRIYGLDCWVSGTGSSFRLFNFAIVGIALLHVIRRSL